MYCIYNCPFVLYFLWFIEDNPVILYIDLLIKVVLQMVRTTTNGLVKTNGTHETNAVNDSYTFVKPTVKNKENAVPVVTRVVGVGSVGMGKGAPVSPRTITNGVATEKPAKPEKPERRLNSRELIEKQKNWTSHFSKTRTSARYMSS